MTMTGAETIAVARKHQSETLLAFSRGKDSVAAWLAIRDHFDRVLPFYMVRIPGLEIVEESLDYFERFFGVRIARLTHPATLGQLRNLVFQPPERCLVIEQADIPRCKYSDVREVLIDKYGLSEDALVADGVRAADSPVRRLAIMKHGSVNFVTHKYHPVWDWKKADLVACFKRNGVKLPQDYKLFGRTLDGLDLRFMLPLKKHRPKDYQRVLELFPYVELEIFRWEHRNG
jgi:3'-phosphoadenosine 5'-phosphosulfate sulfotransferase (PAPS reductase)/FAD synthetase